MCFSTEGTVPGTRGLQGNWKVPPQGPETLIALYLYEGFHFATKFTPSCSHSSLSADPKSSSLLHNHLFIYFDLSWKKHIKFPTEAGAPDCRRLKLDAGLMKVFKIKQYDCSHHFFLLCNWLNVSHSRAKIHLSLTQTQRSSVAVKAEKSMGFPL